MLKTNYKFWQEIYNFVKLTFVFKHIFLESIIYKENTSKKKCVRLN